MEKTKYKGMLFAIIGGIFWGLSGVFGQYLFFAQRSKRQMASKR